VGHKRRQSAKREIAGFTCAIYLFSLSLFVLFPRPILETDDSSAIAQYLETHANFFYKILYADSRFVAIANLFMLVPLPVILNTVSPSISLKKMFLLGVSISALIELAQLFIAGRVSDVVDFLFNSLSVLMGIAIVRFLRSK